MLGNNKLSNYSCRACRSLVRISNLGFLVHDVARLMRVAYDRRARALGLTRSQWWVLNYLYFNEGITQSALADLLDVEKPTLGRLLDRLEAKGWIARQADRHDRRAKRVYLTGEVQARDAGAARRSPPACATTRWRGWTRARSASCSTACC